MKEMSVDQAMQMAMQHNDASQLREAQELLKMILAKFPEYAPAWNLFAIVAYKAARYDVALELVQRAVKLNPNSIEYISNLGNLLSVNNQFRPAIQAYKRALEIDPRAAEVYNNLGNAYANTGDFDRAIESQQQAIRLNPNLFQAYTNLGNTLRDMGRIDEAIAAQREALRVNPNSSDAYTNLGDALTDRGEIDQAIQAHLAGLAIQPDHAEIHCNLALCLLLKGDFEAGWREFEWRGTYAGQAAKSPEFIDRLWDGTPLNGRTLFVQGEQGLGDTIQFIRYTRLIHDLGGRIAVSCQPTLIPLLKQLDHISHWQPRNAAPPPFDVQCPMLSLPRILKTRLENIPAQIPLLKAAADRSAHFRARTQSISQFRVGVVWAGNSEHKNDRNRSVPFNQLSMLADVPGIIFFNLQKGPASAQAKYPDARLTLVDFTDELNDFSDTAALVENLDLVISVDTAVAHLAGAMGKPVWILLPHAPDWRWMLNRTDSPWYPSMRLFRQPRPGDWASVIAMVAKALQTESLNPAARTSGTRADASAS